MIVAKSETQAERFEPEGFVQRHGQSSLFGFGSCDARSGEGIRALEDLIQVLFELVENRVACLSGEA